MYHTRWLFWYQMDPFIFYTKKNLWTHPAASIKQDIFLELKRCLLLEHVEYLKFGAARSASLEAETFIF